MDERVIVGDDKVDEVKALDEMEALLSAGSTEGCLRCSFLCWADSVSISPVRERTGAQTFIMASSRVRKILLFGSLSQGSAWRSTVIQSLLDNLRRLNAA